MMKSEWIGPMPDLLDLWGDPRMSELNEALAAAGFACVWVETRSGDPELTLEIKVINTK